MLIVYNLLLTLTLIVAAPALIVKVLFTRRYRQRIRARLGMAGRGEAVFAGQGPRLWLHALSVGEVASCVPLARALRERYPDAAIILSVSTATGETYARQVLAEVVDQVITFPLDLPWSVRRVAARVRPDLFILVETDFWPNILAVLRRAGVGMLLINGRISSSSWRWYRRFGWFFRPLFQHFAVLSMQTATDAERMAALVGGTERVAVLGNLKYGLVESRPVDVRGRFGIPTSALVWVAGSTHPGEEGILFQVFARLVVQQPELFLILAPRDPGRAGGLCEQARGRGLKAFLRSAGRLRGGNVMVIDSMGELAGLYGAADLAFVGGSLVAAGGHNPLEPAAWGVPVLFGPHMEDFSDISRELLDEGGGAVVKDEQELATLVTALVTDSGRRQRMGERGQRLVAARRRGVVAAHLGVVARLLESRRPEGASGERPA